MEPWWWVTLCVVKFAWQWKSSILLLFGPRVGEKTYAFLPSCNNKEIPAPAALALPQTATWNKGHLTFARIDVSFEEDYEDSSCGKWLGTGGTGRVRTFSLKSEIVCNWCSFLCHLASSYVQTLPEESTRTWMGPKQEKSAWNNPCHTSHHHRTIPVPIIQIRWHSCKTTLEALGGRTLTPLARPIPSKQLPERPEGDFF